MEAVNEKSQAKLTLTFKDETGALVTPSTFKYQIDDVVSATVIKATIEISPGGSTYTITIPSDENRILNSNNSEEERRVTVQWYSGSVLIGTADYCYKVLNLNKVPLS